MAVHGEVESEYREDTAEQPPAGRLGLEKGTSNHTSTESAGLRHPGTSFRAMENTKATTSIPLTAEQVSGRSPSTVWVTGYSNQQVASNYPPMACCGERGDEGEDAVAGLGDEGVQFLPDGRCRRG